MSEITKIEAQKRNKNRVNIYIDGEYAISTSIDMVYKENLRKGQQILEKELNNLLKEDNYEKCKEYSLKVLERSYKSEKQIIDKLKEKGFLENEISRTVTFLKEYNFIDNNKLANMFAKDKIKKYGVKKIKYDLKNKGFTDEEIEQSLETINIDEMKKAAIDLGRKKYNLLLKKESDLYKIKNKLYSYLASRGYDYSLIKDVEEEIVKEF